MNWTRSALWTSKSRDEDCALRAYTAPRNVTDWKQHAFGMEVALHERMRKEWDLENPFAPSTASDAVDPNFLLA